MTVTCATPDCVNVGIAIEVPDDIPAYCGPCGSALSAVPVKEN